MFAVFGIHDLAMFVIAGLLLNITPGADTLYIVGRSASQGARAGAVAALGIGAGCFVHVSAAALGLSALLSASALGFAIVKYVGAAYLFYLGVSMILCRSRQADPAKALVAESLSRVFWGGFLTNALNPKVALFFLAFLPQFIDPASPSKGLGMLFLGVVFSFNGTLWNLFVAWSSATVSSRFKASSRLATWLNRTCGGLFLYFSLKLLRSEA
jgi:threonine/homoserine/homoserine lactone efflux protein